MKFSVRSMSAFARPSRLPLRKAITATVGDAFAWH